MQLLRILAAGSPILIPGLLVVAVIATVGAVLSVTTGGDGGTSVLVSEEPEDLGTRAERAAQTASASEIDRGRELFFASGCNLCHGDTGEGGIGPALPGHSATQVLRQVRSPIAIMPLFDERELSDDDLIQIAAFIASLEGGAHGHEVEAAEDPRVVLATHHWMALNALKAENASEASHHVGHIIERVRGEHLAAMLQVRERIDSGDLHDAEHTVESMLIGAAGLAAVRGETLHLRLALQAVTVDAWDDAAHHVEHFLEAAPTEEHQAQAGLEAIRRRDAPAAEEELRALLVQEPAEQDDEHTEDDHAEDDHDGE